MASEHSVDYTCGRCSTVLLHADEGQVHGVLIHCTAARIIRRTRRAASIGGRWVGTGPFPLRAVPFEFASGSFLTLELAPTLPRYPTSPTAALRQASVAERPLCSRLLGSEHAFVRPQSPHLFYRVLPNGKGWYWELVDSENGIVARGVSDERVGARAEAFIAAFDRLQTVPEPHPIGGPCPNTFST
jgi:hypothetical protein